jgi:hypothetical protein
VACAAPGFPILRYNSSSTVVDQIESSLVPSATGLTMDDAGYLWASDNVNHKIYKIDPYGTGVEEWEEQTVQDAGIILSANPFSGNLLVTVTGFGAPVDLLVLDTAGRIVCNAETDGVFLWNGTDERGSPLPGGVYSILATDGSIAVSERAVLIR